MNVVSPIPRKSTLTWPIREPALSYEFLKRSIRSRRELQYINRGPFVEIPCKCMVTFYLKHIKRWWTCMKNPWVPHWCGGTFLGTKNGLHTPVSKPFSSNQLYFIATFKRRKSRRCNTSGPCKTTYSKCGQNLPPGPLAYGSQHRRKHQPPFRAVEVKLHGSILTKHTRWSRVHQTKCDLPWAFFHIQVDCNKQATPISVL